MSASGLESLWSGPETAGLSKGNWLAPTGRLSAELSYGLATPGGTGRLTPYAKLELSDRYGRAYRLGSRLNLGPSKRLSLEGGLRERAGILGSREALEYELMLHGRLYW